MGIPKMINGIAQYISEAVARIFGPSDDSYPATGTQPFTGDTFKHRHGADW